MRCKILTAVKMSMMVFWVLTPCGHVGEGGAEDQHQHLFILVLPSRPLGMLPRFRNCGQKISVFVFNYAF
jgi:hypothetical protein